jgi:hypothetical protein
VVESLDFAAYCLMRDAIIADMVEIRGYGHRGPARYCFYFQATEEQIHHLSVDFANSESARFADSVRRLKTSLRTKSPAEA